jgi:hemerythrin superfamily protein
MALGADVSTLMLPILCRAIAFVKCFSGETPLVSRPQGIKWEDGMRNPVKKFVNPLELLASDHETVKFLFEQCDHSGPGMKRRLLSQEIFENLHVHATLEEEIFYPAVQENLSYEDGAVVREAYREHGHIKELIRQLEAMDERDATFSSRLMTLKDRVSAHADKEEKQIFPLAERHLPLTAVALAMDKRRIQLMIKRPAPSVLGMLALALVGIGLMMFMFGGRGRSSARFSD